MPLRPLGGDVIALGANLAGGVLAYGDAPQLSANKPATVSCRAKFATADFQVLFEVGGCFRLTMTPSGSGWKAGATVFATAGTAICLSDEIDLDVEYRIAASYDKATGDLTLYVDAVEVNDTTFGGPSDLITGLPIWRVGSPAALDADTPDSWITDCAAWSRVLTAAELDGYTWSPAELDGISLKAWWDFSDASTYQLAGASPTDLERINDKSSNARDFYRATAANYPQVNTATLNGRKVLDVPSGKVLDMIDGVNTSPISANYWKFLHDGSDALIVMLFKPGITADPNTLYTLLDTLGTLADSTRVGVELFWDDRSGSSRNEQLADITYKGTLNQTVENNQSSNGVAPAQQWVIGSWRLDGNNGTAANRSVINANMGADIKNNSASSAVSSADAQSSLRLGNTGSNPFASFVGQFAEIVITDNHADRSLIEDYLNTKYGLGL